MNYFPIRFSTWKEEFLSQAEVVFTSEKKKENAEKKEEQLYQKIGQLQIEINFKSYTDYDKQGRIIKRQGVLQIL